MLILNCNGFQLVVLLFHLGVPICFFGLCLGLIIPIKIGAEMKKLLNLSLAASLLFALTGCGNEDPKVTYISDAGNGGADGGSLHGPTLEPVMLNYLNEIKGSKTVVGVHNDEKVLENNPSYWSKKAAELTGSWPALWGMDFGFGEAGVGLRASLVSQAEAAWQQGALVNVMMHVCPPTTNEDCGWEGGVLTDLTEAQWTSLLTEGGDLNNAWKVRLDSYAKIFESMNQRGVRVLFRPFHEMNQTLFWWSLAGKPEYTVKLYQLTHDYLVDDKALTNLTFTWNLQDFSTLEADLDAYDPGAGYWDILSLDNYNTDGKGFSQEKYDLLLNKAGDKPIALGEVATLPTPEILKQQPKWTFVMSWAELTFIDNSDSSIKALYSADNVVTLEDKAGWPGFSGDDRLVLDIPGGITPPDDSTPAEPLIIFEDTANGWTAGQSDKVTHEIIEGDADHGKVIQHTYTAGETVSEFIFDSPQDLSDYANGTIEFDLKIVNQPAGIEYWAFKIDCGWPCGTGDVDLSTNANGVTPTVGEWQHYKFYISDLLKLNADNALEIDYITSPIVIVPQPWSDAQIGVVIQLDNIKYTAGVVEAPSVADKAIFENELPDEWMVGQSGKVTQELVDGDAEHGKVLQHTYIGGETVSELIFNEAQDLSAYKDGSIQFDLKIVNQPSGITGWSFKIDCGWPCGTGDVALESNVAGTTPKVGEWQRYKFRIADLLTLNGDNSLMIDYVTAPFVLVPQPWSSEQVGVVVQLDNIVYSAD